MDGTVRTIRTVRADEVLHRFFEEQRTGAAGRRLERLSRSEDDLRTCLDDLAPGLLPAHEVALLALERQFDARSAAARVAPADAVLLVLPVFLGEPRWYGVDLEDRRMRIRLAEPLTREVVRTRQRRGERAGAAAWRVDAAVRHAIWTLRLEREQARRR